MLGLYIHIPFCKKICPYCDFYKMVVSNKLKDDYIDSLIKHLKKEVVNQQIKTIYIGGGTPSSLPYASLSKLLKAINDLIDIKKVTEFTIELNPEDIDEALIILLKKYNINRLSIGVQTLNKKYQDFIKRYTSYESLNNIVTLLNKYQLTNYSFDLMYGFLHQTKKEVFEDIELITSLNPKHISIYALIIEEHTIFGYLQNQKLQKICVNDDEQSIIYYSIINKLQKLGYHQYETSNFALEGFKSLHNLIYWNDENYLGIGCGASGFINNLHYTIKPNIKAYINALNNDQEILIDQDILNEVEARDEFIIMNLRKTEGVCETTFKKRFNKDLLTCYPNIPTLIKKGYLKHYKKHYYINKKYFFVQNSIIASFIK